MGFWFALAMTLIFNVISYILRPKPDTSGDWQSQDLRAPTADAGKPVPVVFGEITVVSPNVMFYGDIDKDDYEVDA